MGPNPNTGRDDAGPLSGMRILVVDDHTFTIGLVKDVLYAAGAAQVDTALDGAEAITMLRPCQPHMIITDWRMPGLDGLGFTRIVRKAAVKPDSRIPDPQTPIVLLSAHASARAVETARRAGVTEVVVKPFTIAALIERLIMAANQPRPFVVSPAYVGPDRRRRRSGHGAKRRAEDRAESLAEAMETSMLKQLQQRLEAEVQPRKRTKATAETP